jgi:predicted permease
MRLSDLRRGLLRLAAPVRSTQAESELSREVEAHLRLMEDDLVARGMSREEARSAARRAFGGIEQMKERQRDTRGFRFLTGWRMDLALAIRMTVRHTALSAIAILGITVGIAMSATMFTLVGEQLSPSDLPLPDGRRIVALQQWDSASNLPQPLRAPDVVAWREQLSTVRHLGAFRTVTRNLIVPPAAPQPIDVAEMSAAGFAVAGVAPAMGRAIRPEDEQPGAAPVVVIGLAEWRSRFGANPRVLDTTVQLGATHHTIVGVMPEGFAFPINHAYWIPLRVDAFAAPAAGGQPLTAFGQLAAGATLQSAQAELTAVGERAQTASPTTHQHLRPRVVPYAYQFSAMEQPENRLALQLGRFFITLLVVVISINVAVLVYARTAARQAEIAVRTALGASRGRIIAQMFAEGLVLAALGGLAGVSLAAVALRVIRQAFSQEAPMPFWYRFTISGDTIAFVVVLAALAAAVIGALPAWKATGSKIQNRLQALTVGGGSGMHLGRVWTALILLQVAFAVGLLPMVLVRTAEIAAEATAPFGFAADEYLTAHLTTEQPSGAQTALVQSNGSFARQYRAIEQRITQTGTVRAITFSSFAPGAEAGLMVRSDMGATDVSVKLNRVAVNFFDAFGVRILTGRNFTNADAAPQGRSVIVSRSFAQAMPAAAAVVGSRIRPATAGASQAISGLGDHWYQIVGIVDDFPAPAPGTESPDLKVYRAITPEATSAVVLTLHVHAADLEPWITQLRQIAASLDPTLQLTQVTSMDAVFRENQRNARLLAGVLAIMALSVLLLSAAGIYAMTSFAVMQRRREIGIRLALGAGARTILWTIFSRSAAQLLLGTGLGTGVALLLNRAADGTLLETHARVVIPAVVLLITVASLLAALGPARQGLRIEPTEALRDPSR